MTFQTPFASTNTYKHRFFPQTARDWNDLLNSLITSAEMSGDCVSKYTSLAREAPWPSGRASDYGARGRGFDPHSGRRVVSLSKIHLPPKNTGNTQEDMTEKLLTGT